MGTASNDLLVIVGELRVEYGKHLLIQFVEEFVQHLGQVHLAPRIVRLQLHEEIGEHVRVLLVNGAIRALEHGMELFLRVDQQLLEIFCK